MVHHFDTKSSTKSEEIFLQTTFWKQLFGGGDYSDKGYSSR